MVKHDEQPEKRPRGVFPVRDSEETVETTDVDSQEILDRVEALEIHEWTYSSENGNEVEHLSPAAEDFYELFELGEAVDFIAAGDADGVALTAIKELADRLDEQHALADRHERCIERQQEIIIDQRDDIEILRERLESIQMTVVQLQRQIDERG